MAYRNKKHRPVAPSTPSSPLQWLGHRIRPTPATQKKRNRTERAALAERMHRFVNSVVRKTVGNEHAFFDTSWTRGQHHYFRLRQVTTWQDSLSELAQNEVDPTASSAVRVVWNTEGGVNATPTPEVQWTVCVTTYHARARSMQGWILLLLLGICTLVWCGYQFSVWWEGVSWSDCAALLWSPWSNRLLAMPVIAPPPPLPY